VSIYINVAADREHMHTIREKIHEYVPGNPNLSFPTYGTTSIVIMLNNHIDMADLEKLISNIKAIEGVSSHGVRYFDFSKGAA
tara:strand:+ start:352 stop:600 length:249 start_codon:yes stop_codon:yes gene_type:complete